MGRKGAWSAEENEALAKAYVTIGEDPVFGTDQSADTFFAKVYEQWLKNMKFENIVEDDFRLRSASAAKAQWQTNVNKYVQSFSTLLSHKKLESGDKEEDHHRKVIEAWKIENPGKKFVYYKAWLVLRNVDKWGDMRFVVG